MVVVAVVKIVVDRYHCSGGSSGGSCGGNSGG